MDASSAAATIWWTFWSQYLSQVFQPWWTKGKGAVHLDTDNLALASQPGPLQQDLEQWTLHYPANPAFTPPGGTRARTRATRRHAPGVRPRHRQPGHEPGRRARHVDLGPVHSRVIPSLTGAPRLRPLPGRRDPRT